MNYSKIEWSDFIHESLKEDRSKIDAPYSGPLRVNHLNHLVIDITYSCNMACFNCNRLSNIKNKPKSNISFIDIVNHTKNWIKNKNPLRSIAIQGGEPTVHPEFIKIIKYLSYYCHTFKIQLSLFTNGGTTFQKVKDKIPKNVIIINSYKLHNNQPHHAITVAPIDSNNYDPDDNPCRESLYCGITLNKNGYFVCPTAGAIDNFLNLNLAVPSGIENVTQDKLREKARDICKYCATYLREKNISYQGVHETEQKTSPFWENKLKL
jgi:hypothetical protein